MQLHVLMRDLRCELAILCAILVSSPSSSPLLSSLVLNECLPGSKLARQLLREGQALFVRFVSNFVRDLITLYVLMPQYLVQL